MLQRTAATAALPRRAAIAVARYANGLLVKVCFEQVAQMPAYARRAQVQTQLLVEVAVRQPALPIDADHIAAHHAVQVLRLKAALEQIHVGVKRALGYQR